MAVTGLVVVLVFAILVYREPTYRGRTVVGWLRRSATAGNVYDKEVYEAFRKLGSKAVPIEIKAFTRTDSQFDKWYRRNYPKGPPWLQKLVPKPVEIVQLRGAARLALHLNQHTGEHLAQILPLTTNGDASIRAAAASLIAVHLQPDNSRILPSIAEALANPDPVVRAYIANSLGKCTGTEASRIALPALHEALHDSSVHVRINAAGSLATVDTNAVPMSVPVLRGAMADGDLEVRVRAATTFLLRIDSGSPEAIRVLVAGLTNLNADLRSLGIHLRARLNVTLASAEDIVCYASRRSTNVIALLSVTASEDPDPEIQMAARKVLDRISQEAVPSQGKP